MNSKLKRPLLAAGIVVGVCALVWGGLTLLRNGSRSAVKVYPVTEIGMTEYGGCLLYTSTRRRRSWIWRKPSWSWTR